MKQPRTPIQKKKSTLKTISMMIMLIVATGGCLLMLSYEWLLHQNMNFIADMSSHKTLLMYWRYGIYAVIFLCWPSIIRHVGSHKHWSQESVDYLAKQRLLVLFFFAAIELFLVYNILGRCFLML